MLQEAQEQHTLSHTLSLSRFPGVAPDGSSSASNKRTGARSSRPNDKSCTSATFSPTTKVVGEKDVGEKDVGEKDIGSRPDSRPESRPECRSPCRGACFALLASVAGARSSLATGACPVKSSTLKPQP